jgi:DNA-binding transcriptional MocR family regulator
MLRPMSVRVSTWAWQQPLVGADKLVLLALADQANDAGSCWPGQATLAKKCGISERTLQSRLAKLESGGYIARERRHRSDGPRTSDLYTLALPADFAAGPSDQAQVSHRPPAKTRRDQAQTPRVVLLKGFEPSVKEPLGEPGRAPLDRTTRRSR